MIFSARVGQARQVRRFDRRVRRPGELLLRRADQGDSLQPVPGQYSVAGDYALPHVCSFSQSLK